MKVNDDAASVRRGPNICFIETTYCGAVDNIGDKIIGCSRTIDSKEIMLMRSSTRVPYTILCESHKNRLLRHNCCPTCGVFCTQVPLNKRC
jgi:hypothetical protein